MQTAKWILIATLAAVGLLGCEPGRHHRHWYGSDRYYDGYGYEGYGAIPYPSYGRPYGYYDYEREHRAVHRGLGEEHREVHRGLEAEHRAEHRALEAEHRAAHERPMTQAEHRRLHRDLQREHGAEHRALGHAHEREHEDLQEQHQDYHGR